MNRAEDTARYLLHLASNEPEPTVLTHLQLQKLLYYVQGWSLAADGKPFFDARVEAWQHGPVVREVYPVFADYGNGPVDPGEGREFVGLSEHDKAFIASIWEHYKQYSASALRQMTHAEPPWREARAGLPETARCDHEIAREGMQRYFESEARDEVAGEVTWDRSRRALKQCRAGQTKSLEQVLRELGD